jgi:hypothetical protein
VGSAGFTRAKRRLTTTTKKTALRTGKLYPVLVTLFFTMSTDKCPVDHKSLDNSCPVDHTSRSTWGKILPHSSDTLSSASASRPSSTSTGNPTTPVPESLSTSREVSSIPRGDKELWVYPSEAQFYAAMARKDHDPKAPDMKVVVPIHNAVNERAWAHIKEWEAGRGGDCCGGIRLVSFKGRPGEPSPKARILTLLGRVLLRHVRAAHQLNMPIITDTTLLSTGTIGSWIAVGPASVM